MSSIESCLILGAGISGLVAAKVLCERGIRVTILDKGRGVGGRLATRRLEVDGETATFDHGAQFFTARSPEFRETVARWQNQNLVREWFRGQTTVRADGTISSESDGHPRFCAVNGMTAIAKDLAHGLDVRLSQRVATIEHANSQWKLQTEDNSQFTADALILTPPVAQSLALLDNASFSLPETLRRELEAMQYAPCVAALIVLDGAGQIPAPGNLYFEGEPINWMTDNFQKGISKVPGTITIHAAPQWSRDNYALDDATTIKVLCEAAAPFLGAQVKAASVARWRYSKPIAPRDEGCLFLRDEQLFFAGDAFGGAKVEGAFRSGLAAAHAILA